MKNQLHCFASANSGKGFVSFFDNINQKNGFTYVLKGAPGTGKSTLMKKVAESFAGGKEKIEYFYCSSDTTSLDAVHIVSKGVAIVDGTAPHITEATLPSVNSQIVNLGQFVESKISHARPRLELECEQKSKCYAKTYQSLSVAYEIDKLCDVLRGEMSVNIGQEYDDLFSKLNVCKQTKKSTIRHLFLSATDESGIVDLTTKNKFAVLECEVDNLHFDKILTRLVQALEKLGYDLILFHNPLCPNRLSSVLVIELDLLIKNKEIANSKHFDNLKKSYDNYLKIAGKYLASAKSHHQQLEKIYISNLDFAGIDKATQELIEKIAEK